MHMECEMQHCYSDSEWIVNWPDRPRVHLCEFHKDAARDVAEVLGIGLVCVLESFVTPR